MSPSPTRYLYSRIVSTVVGYTFLWDSYLHFFHDGKQILLKKTVAIGMRTREPFALIGYICATLDHRGAEEIHSRQESPVIIRMVTEILRTMGHALRVHLTHKKKANHFPVYGVLNSCPHRTMFGSSDEEKYEQYKKRTEELVRQYGSIGGMKAKGA